jgi:hypothetical protein
MFSLRRSRLFPGTYHKFPSAKNSHNGINGFLRFYPYFLNEKFGQAPAELGIGATTRENHLKVAIIYDM